MAALKWQIIVKQAIPVGLPARTATKEPVRPLDGTAAEHRGMLASVDALAWDVEWPWRG